MFTSKQYINNISLFLVAFTNSLLIITISNDFRLTAFIFFLGYLVIFPGLSLINREVLLTNRKIIISVLALLLSIFLILLFLMFDASGLLPAITFTAFCYYLTIESDSDLELLIRVLMFLTAPVLFLEILFSGTMVSAVLLIIIVFYLLNKSFSIAPSNFSFYFLALLSGAILVVSATLFIPYLFFTIYIFRASFKQLFFFLLLSFITFFLVSFFVSEGLIVNYLDYYIESSLLFSLPWQAITLAGILLLYSAWSTSDFYEAGFAAGLFIAVPVIIIFLVEIIGSGLEGLRNHDYIKVLQISVPLFITSIKESEIKMYTGKVMPVEQTSS